MHNSAFQRAFASSGLFLLLCATLQAQSITLKWPDADSKTATSRPKSAKEPAQSNSQGPIDSWINEGTYVNNFFKFSLKFPASWYVIGQGAGPRADRRGKTYVLLMVGSLDRQTSGNRWIVIAAAQPASSNPFPTPQDLTKRETDASSIVSSVFPAVGKDFRPVGKPAEVFVGGRRASRLNIAARTNIRGQQYDTRWVQLIVASRGYYLMFWLCDPAGHQSDSGAAARMLNSLHFFGKAP